MNARPLLLTTAILLFAACTAIAQDGNDQPSPSKDVLPGNQQLPPPNVTAKMEKLLQRFGEQTTNPASMPGKDSFDINEIKKNPALFKELILEHRKDLSPFTKPNAVAGAQMGNAGSTSSGFHLTKDINALASSFPNNSYSDHETPPSFAVANNIVYFAADDGIHGNELWRSDGTAAGTYMVKDIVPGSTGSDPRYITAANGKVYFQATTFADGSKPWISDGTESGTILLLKLESPYGEGYPREFTALGNTVFFVMSAGQRSNIELWKTDGTPAGTVEIGSGGEDISQLTAAGDHLFYTCQYDHNSFNYLFYSIDINGKSTLLKSNIGLLTQLTDYNNKLYFSYSDGTGSKLWESDGTVTGTNPVPNNNNVIIAQDGSSYYMPPFPVVDSVLYVPGTSAASTSTLYKYDATNNKGLVRVKDFGAGYTIVSKEMAVVNKKLYFKVSNYNGTPHNELWTTKGTAASTQIVQSFERGEDIYNLYNGSGILYFVKRDTTFGTELWRVATSASGTSTRIVKDIFSGPAGSYPYFLTACTGKLFFSATDKKKGNELLTTDGNASSTTLVKDIQTVATSSSNAGLGKPIPSVGIPGLAMTPLGNDVVFTAYENAHGSELYKSDGTKAGTNLISDVRPGESGSSPDSYLSKNNAVYFIAYDSDSTYAIYKTDGTKGIAQKMTPDYSDYVPGFSSIKAFDVADNGIVFYVVYHGKNPLWRSDGTAAGTFMLNPDVGGVTTLGNIAFFTASDPAHGLELRKSDGTIAGTRLVQDIYPGSGNASPRGLLAFNNQLYFSARYGPYYQNLGLWKTDGTKTVKLKDSLEIASGVNCVSNNVLYFYGTDYSIHPKNGLWKTDGTIKGTKPVAGIGPSGLIDVNGTVFISTEGIYGTDLYKTDGTTKGTQLVKSFNTLSTGERVTNMVSCAGKLFFMLNNVLWSSDGTDAGTTPVNDPVLSNLQLYYLVAAGNKLFASGYTYQYGTELYEATIDSTTAAITMTKVASEKAVPATTSFSAILYPNPATTVARLQLTGNTQNVAVTISNMSGVQLWKGSNINATSVNLPIDKLASGTYMVTISNGKESKSMKLVVSNR